MNDSAAMELSQFAALASVYLAGMVTPGPDLLLIMRLATRSRKHALVAVAGIVSGLVLWVSLTVTGAAAVLSAYPSILGVIQLLGGGWLAYMGVHMLREGVRQFKASVQLDLSYRGSLGTYQRAYRQGLLTNLANPKAMLYFAAVIPPFLPPHPGPMLAVEIIVGLLAIAGIGFSAIALAVGAKVLRGPMSKAGSWIDTFAGGFFIIAGIGLVVAGVQALL